VHRRLAEQLQEGQGSLTLSATAASVGTIIMHRD